MCFHGSDVGRDWPIRSVHLGDALPRSSLPDRRPRHHGALADPSRGLLRGDGVARGPSPPSSSGASASSPTTPASAWSGPSVTAEWSAAWPTPRTWRPAMDDVDARIAADLAAHLGEPVTAVRHIPEGHSGFSYWVDLD